MQNRVYWQRREILAKPPFGLKPFPESGCLQQVDHVRQDSTGKKNPAAGAESQGHIAGKPPQ